ncbi:MAG: nucleoside hydrolase [Pseudomonadota bacterium]
MTATPIIFDTDPGIDDAMALLYAHYCPAIELVGITTVVGNASVDTTTRNALHICERFAIDIPVYRGAAHPLFVPDEDVPTFVHGDDGLGNINPQPPATTAQALPAANYLVDAIRARPGELTLVAVGRLTNLALALSLDPSIQEQVKAVVVMGGAVGTNRFTGNVTPCAEANIYGDPHAADRVLSARWPVTLVPLDATMTCTMLQAQAKRLRDSSGAVGEFIWDITRFYENFYYSRHKLAGFAMHDSLAVGYVAAPELFTTRRAALRVVPGGIARGQTIWAPVETSFPPGDWTDVPPAEVCVAVEADAFLEHYEATIVAGAA